jgi:hypothetical protein
VHVFLVIKILIFNAVNKFEEKIKVLRMFFLVKYNFDSDRCASLSEGSILCNILIGNSQCNIEDNKCICLPGYYRNGNNCCM